MRRSRAGGPSRWKGSAMAEKFERKLDAKLVASVVAAAAMSFSGMVVETAMNVTFPTLMTTFDVGTSTVQWITTGYLLLLAIVVPASSFLKRRFTNKALFLFAICSFIVATAGAALAPSFGVLLACRLLQGAGTGIALPLMMNIIIEQAPLNRIGMMMGIAMFVTSMAPAVGPSVGGLIVTVFGWRGVFVALLPLLFVALALGLFGMRQATEVSKPRFAWIDWLLLSCGFSCLVFALSNASEWGVASVGFLGLLAGCVAFLAAFSWHARREDEPLVRLAALRCAPFAFSALAIAMLQAVVLGYGFLIPNFAQIVDGQTPLVAGCLLLPGCLIGGILSPLSGTILDRFGARIPIVTGAVCIACSAVLFALFHSAMGSGAVIACYALLAFGQGCCCGNLIAHGVGSLSDDLGADGNAMVNTAQQLSGAIGTAIASTIVAAAQLSGTGDIASETAAGTEEAFAVFAFVALGMLVASALGLRRARTRRRSSRLGCGAGRLSSDAAAR